LVSSLVPELAGPSPGESSGETVRPEDLEIREHARRGLLGAVVDPILTKMVQTGIVGSRIGDWDGWLDIQSTLPDLPSPSEVSPLTSPSAPFGKIVQLLEATLLPQASSYGLHLTVLLKGARGSGKKTIARWIAKQVGVHLIEINCFDILGDSDTQTEGVLRARIETAASCGPAILLLQNIDALARKSQAMETGQEPAMSHVLRSCVEKLKGTMGQGHRPVAVFGTTSDPDKCPNGILATFKHEISIDVSERVGAEAKTSNLYHLLSFLSPLFFRLQTKPSVSKS
jgi:peroxin-6